MDAVLIGPYGPTQLGSAVMVLGRTQDNQIVVNDVKASSHHAELRSTGQDYTITDLGSTNGTYVNGQQIDRNMPRVLRTGDTIRIGGTTYTFEMRPNMAMYGNNQGSNPNFAPTQIAQPQYPGTAYGGNPGAPTFPPTQPAADFQQGGFQPYPPQQNSFPPPPVSGSSFNQYNQPTIAGPYAPVPAPQYNPNMAPIAFPPVPGAYPAQGGTIPPYAPPPSPKRGGVLRTVILVVLALIVIVGAISTFFVVHNNQVAASNAQATSTATAHFSATSVAVAQATSTAQVSATGTAFVNATATAGAGGTVSDGPYATGTVALEDPLKDNAGGFQWQEDANCSFNQSVYEVKEAHQNTFVTCFAQSTNFSNFSYRVLTTIISGDCSGIAFRGDTATNKQYYFEVCQSGTYDLLVFDGSTDKYLVKPTNSTAIKSGVGKINLLAITANNDAIQLYANAMLLNTVQDPTLTTGSIGVVAINHTSSSTDVGFAGAKVWTI